MRTPVISIVIGEGGSGGALALAVADRVWMLENSVYSVISPEGCASILWKDAAAAKNAAESLKLTADDAYGFDVAESILEENNIGKKEFYINLRDDLHQEIENLMLLSTEELLDNRYRRFRSLGKPQKEKQNEFI